MNDQDNPVNKKETPVEAPEEAPSVDTDSPAAAEAAAHETADPGPPPRSRRWLRHPVKRVFGGICGGLADFLGVSEGLVRLLTLGLVIITGGIALALYLLFWLFLPVGTQEEGQTAEPTISLRAKHGRWFAYGIIGLGVVLLISNLGLFELALSVGHIVLMPGIFILIGFLILRRFHNKALRQDFKAFRTQAKTASGTAKRWRENVRSGPMGLHRSRRDRVCAGVCGGLGEVLSVDPLLIRLAYIIVAVMTGFVLMAGLYLVLALVLPLGEQENQESGAVSEPPAPLAAA